MSVVENLSIAANAFQVVGFADTVFHAGRALYELFDKARSASTNVVQLLLELQALLSVVASVRAFITEYAASPFVRDEGQTLPNLHTILTLIEQDFRHLKGLLMQAVGSGLGGWFSSMLWALKDNELESSRQRLARYTQNLNAAMSVTGRRSDIVIRTKIQIIEERLQIMSLNNPSQVKDWKPGFNRTSALRMSRRQAKVTFGQSRGSSMRPARTQGELRTRTHHTVSTRADNRVPISPFVNTIYPEINIYEQVDGRIVIDRGNYALHDIMKPALLLQSLLASFDAMRINRVVSIGETEVQRLHMIFHILLASAHSASAENIMEQYLACAGITSGGGAYPASPIQSLQRRGRPSVRNRTALMPTYLEQKSLELDTEIGSVKVKMLLARSKASSLVLSG